MSAEMLELIFREARICARAAAAQLDGIELKPNQKYEARRAIDALRLLIGGDEAND